MKRTPEEISILPKFSKKHIGGVYKITDSIYIDNREGFGATRTHPDIKNRGFVARLLLSQILEISGIDEDVDRVSEIVKRVEEGHGVACPSIYIDVDYYMSSCNGPCKLMDFSDIQACYALRKLGVEELDFQVVMLGYSMKNVENRSNFLNWFGAGLVTPTKRVLRNFLTVTTFG